MRDNDLKYSDANEHGRQGCEKGRKVHGEPRRGVV